MSRTPPQLAPRRGHGASLLGWALVWLVGTSAIAGVGATRYAPLFERLMSEDVQRRVAPLADTPVLVSVRDHEATLSGDVADTARREALLAAAADGIGIRRVVDRLGSREPAPEEETAGEMSARNSGDEPDRRPDEPGRVSAAAGEARNGSSDETTPVIAAADDDAPSASEGNAPPARPAETVDAADATAPDVALPEPAGEASGDAEVASPEPAGRDAGDDADAPASPARVALAEPPAPASTTAAEAAGTRTRGDASDAAPTAARSAPEAGAGDAAEQEEATPPMLRLDIFERVLTVNGTLSVEDDPARLVATAMDSFDLDYVSNGIEVSASVARAEWLESVTALLPELARLQTPGVEALGRRITLRGEAPDRETHDGVVAAALGRLGDYALVERIDVAATDADGGGETEPGEASVTAERRETDARAGTGDGNATPEGGRDATVPAAGTLALADAESGERAARDGAAEALRAAMARLPSLEIRFRSDSDTLSEESYDRLDAIAAILAQHPSVRVSVDGHTDSAGAADANLRLSQARANAVRDYLVSRGVSVYRLVARGFGEELPVADNTTIEGRAANRRIEFTF